jgi:hypothetical protein
VLEQRPLDIDRLGRSRRTDDGDAAVAGAAAEPGQQVDRARRRRRRDRGVDPTFEPARRFAEQLVPSRGTSDRGRLEVRGLNNDRPGVRGDLGAGAAHHPSDADRPGPIGDEQVVGIEPTGGPVKGAQNLTGRCPPHDDRAVQAVGVIGVQRLPELEHHVVGDVHCQRNRTHPGQVHAPLQPFRRSGRWIKSAHAPRDEDVAPLRVEDLHPMPGSIRCRDGEAGGIEEIQSVRRRSLASDPAHGEGIAPIRGHRNIEHLVTEFEHGPRIGTRVHRQWGIGRVQNQDPFVGLADTELPGRADHAVRDVAVGPTCGDRNAPAQHRSWQGDHNQIAHGEIVRPADDPPRFGFGHIHLAPADRLAVLLRLVEEFQDATDNHGSGDVGDPLDRLHLESGAHQAGCHQAPGLPRWQRDVLTEPRQRDPHQSSIPNGTVKRTSPSTMSRMSLTPWRNMRVRSIPMPNAKP